MKKTLSIIIPSYNTSKFIRGTIDSIVDESILDEIEILIVNDGSTDSTKEIAEGIAQTYPQSIRTISKENGGHGSTINVGIKEATGKYLKVLDGDDSFDKKELIRFVEQLKEIDVDVIISLYKRVSQRTKEETIVKPDQNKIVRQKFKHEYNRIYNVEDILGEVYGTIHALTYRTELLKQNYEQIKVSEKVFYEDNEYDLYPFAFAKTIFISDCNVYRYLVDQTDQSTSHENRQKRIGNNLVVVENMMKHYDDLFSETNHEIKDYAKRSIARQIFAIFEIYLSSDQTTKDKRKELKKFDLTIKNKSQEVFNTANRYFVVLLLRITSYWGVFAIRRA